MRLLLDTHVFLWWIKGDSNISKSMRTKITEATEVYISSASIWECSIKIGLKKLRGDIKEIVGAIFESGFTELPIMASHAIAVTNLPEIHRDPFDRILIAQAITEPLMFLTDDAILKNYSELVQLLE